MKRGIVEIENSELSALLKAINLSQLPLSLADRIANARDQKDKTIIQLFLSEQEIEIILDSIDFKRLPREGHLRKACNRLQNFLRSLRV